MGPFLFPLCVFTLEASTASCVLNNDGAAAADSLLWLHVLPLKYIMTANHFPLPLTHKSPAGFSSDWIKALTCVAR